MTSSHDAPFFLDLEEEVRALFAQKLEEFAAFCAQHWQMTEKDMKDVVPFNKEASLPGYMAGYNAALTDGLKGAIACWTEDQGL